MVSAFYAFPSYPPTLPETISEAITVLNKKQFCEIIPWTHLKPTGRLIITQVLRQIDKSDLFIYDLSGLNPNVCFELGYAIAKRKRIWGTIDGTNPLNKKIVDDSVIFSSIGYAEHLNHTNIISSFSKEKPFESVDNSFISEFDGILEVLDSEIDKTDILYLKSPLQHTASKKLSSFLKNLDRRIVEFDSLENSYKPFDDLLVSIATSKVLVVHLLNTDQENHREINAVYSLAAGLGVGLGVETLMLAPEPYKPPMDYRNMLLVHRTAKECVEKTGSWIYPILSKGSYTTKPKKNTVEETDTELSLIRFILGDGQAEHEEGELDSFFVETSQYHVGLNEKIALFIGRKGTGKTANLFRMKSKFEESNDNFVVMIKPQSFRLETYVRLINDFFLDVDKQSQITERIWEFIIYSSILVELNKFLDSKPQYYDYSVKETALMHFVKCNEDLITQDIGEKIDYVYERTKKIRELGDDPRTVISVINDEYLHKIKTHINDNLPTFKKIIILIDNLDKAWDFGNNIDLQCKIIFGLIGFHNTLLKGLKWKKGDSRFHIFLREDIYKMVSEKAREPDKLLLNTTRLEWNDKDLLLQVIEDRFMQFDDSLNRKDVWKKLFCESINGIDTRSYLFENINRRPRDLIFFIKSAINNGINHRHSRIEVDDIKSAQRLYFEFLISNTVTEYRLFLPQIRDVLYTFYGVNSKFGMKTLTTKLNPFSVNGWTVDSIVEFLINISFLGIFFDNEMKFAYSDTETGILFSKYKRKKSRFIKRDIQFCISSAYRFGLA